MSLNPAKIYELLFDHFGPQEWWPVDKEYHKKRDSDPRFEIIIGAILTQNTAWANVEKALANLKFNNSLTVKKIVEIDTENLKTMITPSGYFNQKTKRLKILAGQVYKNYKNLDKFFNRELQEIREELLSLNGIGSETADSILLYAGNHPVFVVDAYTKRLCKRVPVKIKKDSYDKIQQYFESELQKYFPTQDTTPLYKELHALIVKHAKIYCNKKPVCDMSQNTSACKKMALLMQPRPKLWNSILRRSGGLLILLQQLLMLGLIYNYET